ncbi:MAG: GGDEF domain-containing protein [bacterium]|nr:GGDEF domain-containing protein [bacterium]
MKAEIEDLSVADEPKKLAADLIISKNKWLTKIRWLYSLFIISFLIIYKTVTGSEVIQPRELLLVLLLSITGNFIFIIVLAKGSKVSLEADSLEGLASLAGLQLNFDLVVLSLLVFFSGGFESPVLVFFIFYIMVSTFLIFHEKAKKNTITAMALVLVIFFTNKGLILSPVALTTVIGFNVILFFSFLISAYLSQNLRENEKKIEELLLKFKEQSVMDGLTGLYNQAYFFLMLNMQMEKAKRYNHPFSLILFDLDNFKNYNDHNGHVLGSEALRRIALLMRKVFRSSDILAKYGGDEFVVILPNSDKIGAFLGADRLRETVQQEPFPGAEHQPLGCVTLSLGIASYPEHGETTTEIMNNADKALYCAKEEGRNKAVIHSPDFDTDITTPGSGPVNDTGLEEVKLKL